MCGSPRRSALSGDAGRTLEWVHGPEFEGVLQGAGRMDAKSQKPKAKSGKRKAESGGPNAARKVVQTSRKRFKRPIDGSRVQPLYAPTRQRAPPNSDIGFRLGKTAEATRARASPHG